MKVAIYVRLSEEDKDKKSSDSESLSIQNQKSLLLQYALERNWEIYNIYSDEDYTGSDRARPAWLQLLKDAESRKFDIIVCKTQSRFTRELEMVEKYIHGLFPVWGIRFIGVVDNADTENKGNKKSRQINGLVNEWLLEDMSESIKAALATRREKGFYIGTVALYGYKKDSENKGRLLIDIEAAKIVREIFSLYAAGHGRNYIARFLNDRGVPNPTEHKRLNGIKYKIPPHKLGTQWKPYTISSILANEMYIGNMVQGKYGSTSYKTGKNKARPKSEWIIVPNTHEPIVDAELWNVVQGLLEKNAKPFGTGEVGIFAKKTRCLFCGYTMRSAKTHGLRYLRCDTRLSSTTACQGGFIPVKELEETVLQELRALLGKNLDKEMVKSKLILPNNISKKINSLEKNRAEYNHKLEEYTNILKNTYIDKSKNIITQEQFIELSKGFSKDKARIELAISNINSEIDSLTKKQNNSNNLNQMLELYSNVEKLDRLMVEKLIDHIKIGKRNTQTKKVPIEIYWNF